MAMASPSNLLQLMRLLIICISIFIPNIFVNSQSPLATCGIDASRYQGWIKHCDQSLTADQCINVGPHCAYCSWNVTEYAEKPSWAGCDYKDKAIKKCGHNYFSNNQKLPCQDALTPSACVAAGPHCSWCSQQDFNKTRCNPINRLEALGCRKYEEIKQEDKSELSATMTPGGGDHTGFNLKRATVTVRAGQSHILPITVTEPEHYPVDLFVTIDISYSMRHVLKTVKDTIDKVFAQFRDQDQFRIGFSTFIDKVAAPMADMSHYRVYEHPWGTAEPPRMYESVTELSDDIDKIKQLLEPIKSSGNVDGPEAALSAMLQASSCQNHTQWRDESLKLLLVITESWFHHAGDGIGTMAGLLQRNPGTCQLESGQKMIKFGTKYDYPSIPHVADIMKEKNIIPIFAVRNDLLDDYNILQKQYFPDGHVAKLLVDNSIEDEKNQDKLVKMIKSSIEAIRNKQSLKHELIKSVDENGDEIKTGSPSFADEMCVGWKSIQTLPTGRQIENYETEVKVVSSEVVHYDLKFSANRHACDAGEAHARGGTYVLSTNRLKSKLLVDVNIQCTFDCEQPHLIKKSAMQCSFQGDFMCGTCFCHPGWTGRTCSKPHEQCTGANSMCKPPNVLQEIQGSSGAQKICKCHQYNDLKVYGKCCQCDENNCPGIIWDKFTIGPNGQRQLITNPKDYINRKTCSGNGYCRCDMSMNQETNMKCDCLTDFTGDDCSCPKSTAACIDPTSKNGEICSGRGECKCGRCECKSGWTGPYCNVCNKNCPSCQEYGRCAFVDYEIMTRGIETATPVLKKEWEDCKNRRKLEVEEWKGINELNPDWVDKRERNEVLCNYYDAKTQCKYFFTYRTIASSIPGEQSQIKIVMERGGRCESTFDYWAMFWSALVAFLCGCLLLCCWRCLIGLTNKTTESPPEPSVVAFVNTKTVVAKTSDPAYKAVIVRSGDVSEKCIVRWQAYKGKRDGPKYHSLGNNNNTSPQNRRNVDGAIELNDLSNALASQNTFEEWQSEMAVFDAGEAFSEVVLDLTRKAFKGRETKVTIELMSIYHQHIDENGNLRDGPDPNVPVEQLNRVSNVHYKLPLHILRDDDPGQVGFAKPSYVFKESDACINLPLQRTMGSDGRMTVFVATRDITAIGGEDFIPFGGRRKYTFEDGDLLKYVTIDLIPRTKYRQHHERSFAVEILDVDCGIIAQATGTCLVNLISDNELANITFAKKVVPCLETDKSVKITVYRTHNNEGRVEIKWRTIAITARAGEDFQESADILIFENGDVEQTIEIPLYENKVQKDEGCTFKVALEDPGIASGVKIGDDGECLVTIIDDDVNGLFEFKHRDMVYRAGNNAELKVPIIRTMGRDADISVDFSIDTNVSGLEEFKNGVVEFLHDEVMGEINLGFLQNLVTREKSIKIVATLLNASKNGRIGDNKVCELTIYPLPEGQIFSFLKPTHHCFFIEGIIKCIVQRTGDLEKATSCTYETVDVTAKTGVNYLGAKGVIIFDKDEQQKEIIVPILSGFFPDDPTQIMTFNIELIPIMPRSETGDCAITEVEIDYDLTKMDGGMEGLRPGQVMIQMGKKETVCRKSQNVERIPIRINEAMSSGAGKNLTIEWEATAIKNITPKITHSSNNDDGDQIFASGVIHVNSKENVAFIEINVGDLEITGASGIIQVYIADTQPHGTCILGLDSCIITILNDIDRGHLSWNHRELTCYTFTGLQDLRILRTGGADTDISVQVHAASDPDARFPALEGLHYSLPNSIVNGMQMFPAKITDVNIPVRLEHVDPSEAEYQMAPNKSLDQIERSFYLVLSNCIGGDIALAKVKITIIDHLGMNKINYLPVLSANSGKGVDDLSIQVVRSGTAISQKCQIPVSCGDWRGEAFFKAYQNSVYFKLPADVLAQFAAIGQTKVVYQPTPRCIIPKEPQIINITELVEPMTIELSKPTFVAKKGDSHAVMMVSRTGALDGKVRVKIENTDPHMFHEQPEIEVNFEEGQTMAQVKVALKNQAGIGKLKLISAVSDHPTRKAEIGKNAHQEFHVLDEDEPSVLGMDLDNIRVDIDNKQIVVPVKRFSGDDMVALKYKTIEDTAKPGIHYLPKTAQIVMQDVEHETIFKIPIVKFPVEEAKKLRIEIFGVQGHNASLNPNLTEAIVEIPSIDHSGVFEFSAPEFSGLQSEGQVKILIKRLRGLKEQVTVPVYIEETEEMKKIKNYLRTIVTQSQFQCTFEEGQKVFELLVPLVKEPKTNLFSNFTAKIKDLEEENTEIGETDQCLVTVNNDIDGGTIGFVETSVQADSLKDIRLKLEVLCTLPNKENSCKWRIVGGKPNVNYRSESASGGRVQWPTDLEGLYLMLLNDPTGQSAEFIVELYEPSAGGRINEEFSKCTINVTSHIPDISVPAEPIIRVKQSAGVVTIPIQRSISQNNKLAAKWSVVGCPDYGQVFGDFEFPDGQSDFMLKIPLLSAPQTVDSHEFTLNLQPINDTIFNLPKSLPQIIVENDIGPGILSFAKNEIYAKQSQDKIKLLLIRKYRFMDLATVKWRVEPINNNDKDCPYLDIPTPDIKIKANAHEAFFEIAMDDEPLDAATHEFKIVLFDAKDVKLDEEKNICHVTVENDISAGTVGFKQLKVEIKGWGFRS